MTQDDSVRLRGAPVSLSVYPAAHVTNRRFIGAEHAPLAGLYLPSPMTALVDAAPVARREFIEDDNRSAIGPEPAAVLDGTTFYLSVKGIGSTVEPFSERSLDRFSAAQASSDAEVGRRLRAAEPGTPDRIITGELWLRGSPYGGQGARHAETALRVSERAELTSLAGLRIAPVVHVCRFPPEVESRLRTIRWYRTYPGPFVQELRLVPSNVRIYFHSRTTVAGNVAALFDRFALDTAARARRFQVRLLASVVPLLTLFARTLRFDPAREKYLGLDLYDVWLDKDAVLAPDGTVFFVDLEGIEEVPLDRGQVRERIEDQVYRSLYEAMFAYERVDEEAQRRFGDGGGRRGRLTELLGEALRNDPFVRLRLRSGAAELHIENALADEALNIDFPVVD